MAKLENDPAQETKPVPEVVPVKPVVFRDKEYTSRTLILPDWRVMSVERKQVAVEGDDTVAIAFFRKRSDFELVRE